MFLDKSQLTSILREDGVYDCSLVRQLFSYKLIRDKVSPLGNIFCFESPTAIGPLYLDNALVVAVELPNANAFSGACFQRLLASQIGTFISMHTKQDCWLDQNCLFIQDQQVSITVLNQIKNSVVFNTIFSLKHSLKDINFFQLNLSNQELLGFSENLIGSFHHLTENLFIETCRDNF